MEKTTHQIELQKNKPEVLFSYQGGILIGRSKPSYEDVGSGIYRHCGHGGRSGKIKTLNPNPTTLEFSPTFPPLRGRIDRLLRLRRRILENVSNFPSVVNRMKFFGIIFPVYQKSLSTDRCYNLANVKSVLLIKLKLLI